MKYLILSLSLFLTSCTANQMARNYGGEETVKLPANEVFINATWKDHDLWYLTKDTLQNKYYLREKSSYGLMQGKIIFEK